MINMPAVPGLGAGCRLHEGKVGGAPDGSYPVMSPGDAAAIYRACMDRPREAPRPGIGDMARRG
jgi:hypothetical protein